MLATTNLFSTIVWSMKTGRKLAEFNRGNDFMRKIFFVGDEGLLTTADSGRFKLRPYLDAEPVIRPGVKDELTTVENLRVAAGLSGIALSTQKAADALQKVGLAGRETVPARLLSEGQRRRVSLARLVISTTKLWLLDEVLTALDKTAVVFVGSLIEEHLAQGGMAIVATHQDLELSRGLTQRLELTT